MKTACLSALLAGAALLGGVSAASAQTEVSNIGWELSSLAGKTRAPFAPVTELRASPDINFTDNLRAIITLHNPAAKPVEGLVLRYALTLRLLKNGDAPEKAFWGVPFYVEELRVTKIGPKAERQTKVIHFDLPGQLRQLRSSGFVPTAMKLEIMVCPRQGDEPAAIMRSAVIEILKP